MAKLYFYYASMNAGKSSTLLQTAFNYGERGMRVMLWTAAIDDRPGFGAISSRIGLSSDAHRFRADTDLYAASEYRRKRAGHLLSKGRYLAAQLLAMLDGDLWLENARTANAAAALIAEAAGERLLYPVEANEVFLRLTADEAAGLRDKGFDFYDWGTGAARLVTSWQHEEADVRPPADAIGAL